MSFPGTNVPLVRSSTTAPLQVWGGIECTINRVGSTYYDQLVRNGHQHRPDDLDKLAGLGLKTLRYPVLWERMAPHRPDHIDWRWADDRLRSLQRLHISPIIGLVHHGCGPHYATFDTDRFELELPRYARQVAERYPWVEAYTPINEPLTTARFSGLYGHWYPHGRSAKQFVEILLRQCRAIGQSMHQIRQVQPLARLIQTEDLGMTHSTPLLSYQAEWENNRRWVCWDLLCGNLTPDHPIWPYFRWVGIPEKELWYFVENPCPPSVIGVNHYITSERYLDEAVHNYPAHLWGGNGQHRYVDTEVVRAAPEQRAGLAALLRQTWERYKLPIAVTEAHIGCSVDEQIRWLWEVWQHAHRARQMDIPLEAVTVWSLLGAYDWHCLLTRCDDVYESGAFDVSSGRLQPTALANFVQRLANQKSVAGLVPEGGGWWTKMNENQLQCSFSD